MRRSYEYKESYIVHETRGWNYPSYEEKYRVPHPNTYKVLDEPSFHYDPSYHHYDMMGSNGHHRIHHEDGSHGWSRTQNVDHNLLVKKNEHHALGANTILRRPPLGSVNPSPSHQDSHDHNMYLGKNRWGYGGDVYDEYKGGSSSHNSSWMVMKNSKHKEDSKPYVGVQEFEEFDDGKLGKALNHLIKELDGYPPRGAVKKIEVIQYERRTYGGGGGGFGSQRKDSWFKGF